MPYQRCTQVDAPETSFIMDLLYILLILLIVSRLFGEVAERLGQAPLVGELIAGVLLGILTHQFPDSLPVLAGIDQTPVFTAITDLGIFFLMLMAGIDLHPRELAKASNRALVIAIGGMLVPMAAGFGLAAAFIPQSNHWFAQALFVAVALAITAVPVAVRVLMDLGRLDSPLGSTIVSAAVIDDVLSLILLAALTAVIATGELPDAQGLLVLVGKVGLFFTVTILIGRYVFPRIGRLLRRTNHVDELEFSLLLVAALAYAVLAEALGMHFILGAFLAGLFFGRSTVDEAVYEGVHTRVTGITTGFFAPVFFAGIGLHLTGQALIETPLFLLALIAVAVLSKLIGAGLAARTTRMSPQDSLGVGVAMSSRGAVELIIADIALRAGLFSQPDPTPTVVANLFSAIVIMAITTTILAPILLRSVFRRED